MEKVAPEEERVEMQQETARLAALNSTGILDSGPEASYDNIVQLAAEYFHADSAGIGFADETRVWIKSHWGKHLRELPRENSIFDMVLSADGPVVVSDLTQPSCIETQRRRLIRSDLVSFASVPIRSFEGTILGALSIFDHEPRPGLDADELRMLESLAEMVSNQLELRRLHLRSKGKDTNLKCSLPVRGDKWPGSFDLQRALEERQFVLYYQPEVDLTTHRIIGFEALIRWQHPERGLVLPNDFIPLAEECGMILPIGDWGMAEACNQIRRWNEEGPENDRLRVCVNLSARQFSHEGLADHVESLLLQSGISSRQLGLEMTESSLIPNMRVAVEVLERLRSLGVSLLMDDFGTGYSSLNYLHAFPFDVLKIDRSFVRRITEGDQPMHIVRTIIELARVMDMDVVAEGIETCDQYRLLRQMRCRYGQGFLFARPMPAQSVTELLRLYPGCELPDPEEDVAV